MAKAAIDKTKAWFVVRTNIKCEEKAANNIRVAGFDVYFPRQRIEKRNKRTNTYREFERPLMMRYIFVGFHRHNQAFGFVRNCDGVERILGDQENHPIGIPAGLVAEILDAETNMEFDDTRAARIHREEEARTKKATVAMKFKRGKKIMVTDGPFSSFKGVVEDVTSRGSVKTLVDIFGRWTAVELYPEQLSPAA